MERSEEEDDGGGGGGKEGERRRGGRVWNLERQWTKNICIPEEKRGGLKKSRMEEGEAIFPPKMKHRDIWMVTDRHGKVMMEEI